MSAVECTSPALIVAISGPSGSGKSRLANTTNGVLHIELDRFYRSRADMISSGSSIDWEDVSSYRLDDALKFLAKLAQNEPAVIPIYDLSTDAIVGEELLRPSGRLVVAEGVFAAILASMLRTEGFPVTSICLSGSRLLHACMRAWRDIREGRMSVPRALARTIRAMALEKRYVASSVGLGARVMNRREAGRWLRAAVQRGSADGGRTGR